MAELYCCAQSVDQHSAHITLTHCRQLDAAPAGASIMCNDRHCMPQCNIFIQSTTVAYKLVHKLFTVKSSTFESSIFAAKRKSGPVAMATTTYYYCCCCQLLLAAFNQLFIAFWLGVSLLDDSILWLYRRRHSTGCLLPLSLKTAGLKRSLRYYRSNIY